MIRSLSALLALSWIGLWFTPDQQGQKLMQREAFTEAAKTFEDPMRQGVAWYRAGEFKQATQAFSRISSAEAYYNQGNALLMLGQYDQAMNSYNKALEMRPEW